MEVVARLRFTTPCLGNVRRPQRDLMLRSSTGNVLFLQGWWRACLSYAANAVGRYQKDVGDVQADPEVDGTTDVFKRYYGETEYKEHEAFLAGAEITVRFCLPSSVPLAGFKELMEVAGKYAGISPYGYKQNYGRFSVLSIEPATRKTEVQDAKQ